MTTTSSTVWASSASRWLETNTVRTAQPVHALGIEPVGGLVQHERLGIAEQRRGEREPLPHPHREAPHIPTGCAPETHLDEDLVDPVVRDVHGPRDGAQGVASAAPRVEHVGVHHRADGSHRLCQIRVPSAVDRHRSGRRTGQSQHHPHARALAGAIRADEPGDPTGGQGEGEAVDGGDASVPLRQAGELDECHRDSAPCATAATFAAWHRR